MTMRYLLLGILFAAALAAAASAWSLAPAYAQRAQSEEERNRGKSSLPAALHELRAAEWAVILAAAALCAGLMWPREWSGEELWGTLRTACVLLILMCAAIFDLRTRLIPNFLIAAAFICGAAAAAVSLAAGRPVAELILYALGGLGGFAVFYLLSKLASGGMGMGDVKLISAMGWLVGPAPAFYAVFFGLVLCAVLGVILMLMKKKGKKDLMPFGPFLFLGYAISLILTA